MNSESTLSELKKDIDVHSSINAVAKQLKINRSQLYRAFGNGDMQLSRFLQLLQAIDVTPAKFFARLEGKTVVEGNLIEIEFQLQSNKLRIDFLEKKLAECEAKSKA